MDHFRVFYIAILVNTKPHIDLGYRRKNCPCWDMQRNFDGALAKEFWRLRPSVIGVIFRQFNFPNLPSHSCSRPI